MISKLWTKDKVSWLKNNYDKCTYREMVEHLNISEDSIRHTAKELNLTRPRYVLNGHPRNIIEVDDEFIKDLENPRFTSVDLARKYGVTDSCIQRHRKKRVPWYKPMINTLDRLSTAELKVKRMLDELDVAYLLEKRIGKYSVDFYLGRKCCIEVQGTYWHSISKKKKSDKRKRLFLAGLGYKVLYISEEELKMLPIVKIFIKQFVRVSLYREV